MSDTPVDKLVAGIEGLTLEECVTPEIVGICSALIQFLWTFDINTRMRALSLLVGCIVGQAEKSGITLFELDNQCFITFEDRMRIVKATASVAYRYELMHQSPEDATKRVM